MASEDEIVEPVGEYPALPPNLRLWRARPEGDYVAYYPPHSFHIVPFPNVTKEMLR